MRSFGSLVLWIWEGCFFSFSPFLDSFFICFFLRRIGELRGRGGGGEATIRAVIIAIRYLSMCLILEASMRGRGHESETLALSRCEAEPVRGGIGIEFFLFFFVTWKQKQTDIEKEIKSQAFPAEEDTEI